MAVQFQDNAEPFRKPKSFTERFKDLFLNRTVSPIPEEKKGFVDKMGELFFPPEPPVRIMFDQPKAETKEPLAPMQPSPTPTSTPMPQPFPTPTLTPEGEKHTAPKWKDLVSRYFPNEEVNNALNVMFKESSGNPTGTPNVNKNGSKDYGLMQINDIHAPEIKAKFGYTMDDMLDPEKNIRVAQWLWNRFGWKPWSTAESLGLLD